MGWKLFLIQCIKYKLDTESISINGSHQRWNSKCLPSFLSSANTWKSGYNGKW